MVKSQYDPYREITKDSYVVTALLVQRPRAQNRKGQQGFLIIEKLDEVGNYVAYCIGAPFTTAEPEITCVQSPKPKVMGGVFSGKISKPLSKREFDLSPIGEKINHLTYISTLDIQHLPEYSLQKANKLLWANFQLKVDFSGELPDSMRFTPMFDLTPLINDTSIRWNPFARLIESNAFPAARVHRSSFWDSIKDTFFVFKGSVFGKNDLGLLDYIFPIPRLLLNALAKPLPAVVGFVTAIAFGITEAISSVAAGLLTLALSPVVGMVRLGFELYKQLKNSGPIESVTMKLMKDGLENIEDLNDQDFTEESTLSSFAKTHKQLTIKPVAKNKQLQYEELSKSRPIYEEESLVLGVYTKDESPCAVIEINARNKQGLFALMEKNKFHIDETCEQAGVMDEVLAQVARR